MQSIEEPSFLTGLIFGMIVGLMILIVLSAFLVYEFVLSIYLAIAFVIAIYEMFFRKRGESGEDSDSSS